jgi:hypothetical protein
MGKAHSLAYAAMPMFFWPPPALPVRKMLAERNEDLAREEAERFGFESFTADSTNSSTTRQSTLSISSRPTTCTWKWPSPRRRQAR